METAPNFPWMVTADPMPLIRKMLDAVRTPTRSSTTRRARRMREGSPRIVFATALMRAAFAADLELVKLSARARRRSEGHLEGRRDDALGGGRSRLHPRYHRGKSAEERLQVVKLFVHWGTT
jgi:hypothetical protein